MIQNTEEHTQDDSKPAEDRRQFVRRSEDVRLLLYRTQTAEKTLVDVAASVKVIESEMPMLLAVKGWVIKGGLGVLALLGVALIAMLLKHGVST